MWDAIKTAIQNNAATLRFIAITIVLALAAWFTRTLVEAQPLWITPAGIVRSVTQSQACTRRRACGFAWHVGLSALSSAGLRFLRSQFAGLGDQAGQVFKPSDAAVAVATSLLGSPRRSH